MENKHWLLALALGAAASGCQAGSDQAVTVDESAAALTGTPIDLIAIGSLSSNDRDKSTETAGLLENTLPGNLLGGIGSGLAFAFGHKFLALPDRGPNATPYDSAVGDTVSYINRFHTVRMKLKPSDAGSALPFTLKTELRDTTLLFSKDPLTYGTGAGLGLGSGAPALNAKKKFYLSGRSDNFDPTRPSTEPSDGRFDPESIRVSNDGKSVYISDEYGPYIYEFDRSSGRRTRTITLPAGFAISHLYPTEADEIANNTVGRVTNKGMEGLAITPDGNSLVGAMQSPLLQDGGLNARFTRIIRIDLNSGATQQYAYELTNVGTAAKPKYATISDIVAINDHEFLVLERDGKGLGDNSTAVFKQINHIDLAGAQDTSALSGEANLVGKALSKTLFLDVVANLNAHGIGSNDIPAKLEGLAFGPDLIAKGVTKHTLYLSNDNDFIGTVTDSNHPNSIDNANKFFVFAVDPAQLPGFQAERCDYPTAYDDDS